MTKFLLPNLDYFRTTDLTNTNPSWGADQDWFLSSDFHRKAGCGPTTATNILAYLSQTQPEYTPLWSNQNYTGAGYQQMMEKIWTFVTPKRLGLYSFKDFSGGIQDYGKSHNLSLKTRILDISYQWAKKLPWEQVERFLKTELEAQNPIAFLNYSNGNLKNLESWHWVTLIGYQSLPNQNGSATIIDNGLLFEIDFKNWYQSTLLGGALVSVK